MSQNAKRFFYTIDLSGWDSLNKSKEMREELKSINWVMTKTLHLAIRNNFAYQTNFIMNEPPRRLPNERREKLAYRLTE